MLFFLCPVTDISATVARIGVKFCMMVHIGSGQIFSLFGGGASWIPQVQNFGPTFWSFTGKTVSRSVARQLELSISSTTAFEKCKSRGSSPPPGECTPVWRVCVMLTHLLLLNSVENGGRSWKNCSDYNLLLLLLF